MAHASSPEARLRWTSRGIRLAAGLLLVGGAVGLFALLRVTRPEPARVAPGASAPVAPVIEVRRIAAPLSYTGHGLARAMREAGVSAQVQARVVERPAGVEPGLPVRRGDLLVALDDTEFAHRVESAAKLVVQAEAELAGLIVEEESARTLIDLAEAEVAIQQRDLERARDALAQGAGSESEVDLRLAALRRAERELAAQRERLMLIPSRRSGIESRLASQRAQLAVAEEELSRTRITSPIDGFLQEVAMRPGDLAAPGMLVARIVDLGRLEIPLRLPASAAAAVAPGDEARLWLDGPGAASWGGEANSWGGQVARIAPDVEAASRSLVVYIEVEQELKGDPRDALRPGQFLVGRVVTREARAGLLVPRRAIQDDRVWVVEPLGDGLGRLARRQVMVGRYLEGEFPAIDPRETQWAVVAEGVQEGELIAVGMAGDLQDGQMVQIAGPGSAGKAPDSQAQPREGARAPGEGAGGDPGGGAAGRGGSAAGRQRPAGGR